MRKNFLCFLLGSSLLGSSFSALASDQFTTASRKTKDSAAVSWSDVQEYMTKRGYVETRGRGGVLRLAGDVRARWIYAREDLKKEEDTFVDTKTPLPINRYRSEFNMYVSYQAENNWMSSKMRWAAVAGGENTAAGVDIDRAFIGYRLFRNPATKSDFFIEIGRSGLGDMFESEVQFSSQFDGVHVYCSRRIAKALPWNVIIHGGPFVVNMATKHYAWVAEGILSNLPANFLMKYSIIDWNSFKPETFSDSFPKSSAKPSALPQKYEYLVGQFLLGNRSSLPWGKKKRKSIYLYGAVLTNYLAKATETTLNKKENFAWFVGGTLGSLRQAGDWSVTVRYEVVEALAVPEIDVSGIGRGNSLKYWFAQAIAGNYEPKDANGFTNYKGVSGLFTFGLTNSLSFRAYGAYSRPENNKLGTDFTYRKFDVGLISAF
ncbi:hypothetical protein [Chlamydiifrater phoenicopteri]|uniref:hypothetical protein n=1 Tax=Chlamydiifrater phoenicopteri TaxID=2681469 RepID=UPI001BCBB2C0|nr:hypothetical protein [Chlamydiifrater phoenicopteri]